MTEIFEIHVPEYNIDKKPDYIAIGKKVDEILAQKLGDGKWICRAIGSDDHPGYTIDELAQHIAETGTDKYDPDKKEVAHEHFNMYDHDMHAGVLEIKNRKVVVQPDNHKPTEFGDIIYNFYENALHDRGYSVRIDILILYDPEKMENAELVGEGEANPRHVKYLYKFKDPDNKKDAVLAVVKILR